MKPEKVFSIIAQELELVEEGLKQAVEAAGSQLKEIGTYVFGNKGKRIRPAIFLLIARCKDNDLSPYIDGAVALELVHTASLLHDDVIDHSPTRRGRPSVHVRWDNRAAILAGDFLLSRSFQLLLSYRSWPLFELLSRVVQEMAEGEIEQAYVPLERETMEEQYFNWIGKKTAVFFSGCSQAGSLISGAVEEEQQIWADFGYNFGVAFQLIDDLLDYTADSAISGKPALGDLRNRVLTLPLIYTLKTSAQRDTFHRIFFGNSTTEERERLTRAVREEGGVAYTLQKALEYAGRAKASLSALPAVTQREQALFEDVIELLTCRKY